VELSNSLTSRPTVAAWCSESLLEDRGATKELDQLRHRARGRVELREERVPRCLVDAEQPAVD